MDTGFLLDILMHRRQRIVSILKDRYAVETYSCLQRSAIASSFSVAGSSGYQREFKRYYRIRWGERNGDEAFFSALQDARQVGASFEQVLDSLHDHTGRWELSFVSKLFATIDPALPPYDELVRIALGLRWTRGQGKERKLDVYNDLKCRTSEIVRSERFSGLRTVFDEEFPNTRT